jgi:hypothetical protein
MKRLSQRKERITVSLSRDSVRFLRAFRSRTNSPSLSAAFEKIVADLQGAAEKAKLDENTRAYYDSLSPEQMEENKAWGKLGEAALQSIFEGEERRPRAQLRNQGGGNK